MFGEKYEGFHVSDSDGKLWVLDIYFTLILGSDRLCTFKEILEDITEAGTLCKNDVNKQ